MLREIGSGRQDGSRGLRRWFQDDYFDLYVWQDASGALIALQLCYDRNRKEGAITWDGFAGFGHDRVDGGEQSAKHPMTPILRADGAPPYFRIYDRFLTASAGCPQPVRDFAIDRLRDYRIALFGMPRSPRRKRSEASTPASGARATNVRAHAPPPVDTGSRAE
jgi:hypothetical protein